MQRTELESLTGVGPATAETLYNAGFVDRQSIASASVAELSAVKGFAEARARALIEAAQSGGAAVSLAPDQVDDQPAVDGKKGRSGSDAKKRKKLRKRHADLKRQAKHARKKAKSVSSKKKRKRWAAEADRLAGKAKKTKKRLARLG